MNSTRPPCVIIISPDGIRYEVPDNTKSINEKCREILSKIQQKPKIDPAFWEQDETLRVFNSASRRFQRIIRRIWDLMRVMLWLKPLQKRENYEIYFKSNKEGKWLLQQRCYDLRWCRGYLSGATNTDIAISGKIVRISDRKIIEKWAMFN